MDNKNERIKWEKWVSIFIVIEGIGLLLIALFKEPSILNLLK